MRGLEELIQDDEGNAGTIERTMATLPLVSDDIDKANLASRLKRRWPRSVCDERIHSLSEGPLQAV